jgi:YggT family protein
MGLLATARQDVADYFQILVLVYVILIFVRVLMSWLPRVPYNIWLDRFLTFVRETVDPYLNIWRRMLPMVRIGPGALDLSPIVGTLVLIIVGNIVANLIRGS